MLKLTPSRSLKSAFACLLAAECLWHRTKTAANAVADEAIVEARRSLSDVQALVGDIYAAMQKTNQSLKNSPMVLKFTTWNFIA